MKDWGLTFPLAEVKALTGFRREPDRVKRIPDPDNFLYPTDWYGGNL